MNSNHIVWTVLVCALAFIAPTSTAGDTAQTAFDRLKALEGTWHGEASGGGEAEESVSHVFRLAAAGTVVMETMNPGVEGHEMINMYHLDGDDLVLTHYCAGNNQPTMRLAASSASEMRFDFTGGTNFDPAKDEHIHAARLVLVDADTLESSWTGYNEGKEVGTRTFVLERRD